MAVFADESKRVLALIRDKRADIDERLHVCIAVRGVGDHHAAVGVTHEHNRTGDLSQEAGNVGRIRLEAA